MSKNSHQFPPALAAVCLIVAMIASPAFADTLLQGKVSTRAETIYEEGKGPYEVEIAEGLSIKDDNGKKQVGIEVCYPKSEGSFPVVIFSHSVLASGRDYRPMNAWWASHGYVCIVTTHSDALSAKYSPGDNISALGLIKLVTSTKKNGARRMNDLLRTIDALPEILARIGLAERADRSRMGVIGHQTGSFGVELLAGAKSKKFQTKKPADLKALVAITHRDKLQVIPGKNDWNNISVPFMVLNVAPDNVRAGGYRKKLARALQNSSSPEKLLVTVDIDHKIIPKPSRKEVRKMMRKSNIKLITWRPFFLRKKHRQFIGKKKTTARYDPYARVSQPDSEEMPGESLKDLLGLDFELPDREGRRGRLHYILSITLPFLNAHLKNDHSELDKLMDKGNETFGEHITATFRRPGEDSDLSN